jgi:hypothetical protein
MVMSVAWEWRKRLPKIAPDVPSLTDKTFPQAVNGSKLTVVLFYLPCKLCSLVILETHGCVEIIMHVCVFGSICAVRK